MASNWIKMNFFETSSTNNLKIQFKSLANSLQIIASIPSMQIQTFFQERIEIIKRRQHKRQANSRKISEVFHRWIMKNDDADLFHPNGAQS
jgi:hypothetical protein